MAVLALGAKTPPAQADDLSRVAAEGGYTVYGPSCRFAACWAVLMNEAGQGFVVRGRGIISTRSLAEAKLRELSAADAGGLAKRTDAICIPLSGGLDL